MTPEQALDFLDRRGVVLVSGKGPVPRLVEVIAGEPIKGSWWGHPKSREIFRVLSAVTDSPEVLVCRAIDGKLTLIHRRLWPALVRAARLFPPERLAKAGQEHTAAGHHVRRDIPFPDWVDGETAAQAQTLGEDEALRRLGDWALRRRDAASAHS